MPRKKPKQLRAQEQASLDRLAAAGASIRTRMEDKSVDERLLDIADRLHWYGLLVTPQREFVAQKILRRYGLRTFVPMRREWRRKNKFVKDKELKAYPIAPRYVFAGFEPGIPLWFDLFNLPNVSGVVGIHGVPKRLPTAAVIKLIRRTGGGLNAPQVQKYMRTHHEFSAGQVVEVIDGPFEGMKIPVVEINVPRAKLLIEMFGTDMEIDLPLDILQAA